MERMKTQVELLKESCDIKDAACVRYQKRIAELEEENKNLKEEVKSRKEYQQRSQSADGEQIERLLGEKIKLEEKNKKLKSKIRLLEAQLQSLANDGGVNV